MRDYRDTVAKALPLFEWGEEEVAFWAALELAGALNAPLVALAEVRELRNGSTVTLGPDRLMIGPEAIPELAARLASAIPARPRQQLIPIRMHICLPPTRCPHTDPAEILRARPDV